MLLYSILSVGLGLITGIANAVNVTVYEHNNFTGSTESFPNLFESDVCLDLVSLSNSVSSVDTQGGCVVLYQLPNCFGGSAALYPGSAGHSALSELGFDNKPVSLRRCPRTASFSYCQSGSFGQMVSASAQNSVEMACYNPISNTRHGISTFGQAIGATMWTKGALRSIPYDCAENGTCNLNTPRTTSHCPLATFPVICGLVTTWEAYTTYTKAMNVICCGLPKYSQVCEVKDYWLPIVTCDASNSPNPTLCGFTRKVGFAHDSTSEQFAFFEDMEFGSDYANVSASIREKFGSTIARSNVTDYNWTSTPDSIWAKETEDKLEFLHAPAGHMVVVFQTVGTCGFFSVRTDHFTLVEYNNSGAEIRSTRYDPHTGIAKALHPVDPSTENPRISDDEENSGASIIIKILTSCQSKPSVQVVTGMQI